jgi:hypothetical protein
LLAGSAEIEARLERQASEAGAYGVTFHLECARRKRNRAHRSRPTHLKGSDYRAIIMDFAKTTRTIDTAENKLFVGDELPSCFGAQGLGHSRNTCEQARNEKCYPRNHVDFPPCDWACPSISPRGMRLGIGSERAPKGSLSVRPPPRPQFYPPGNSQLLCAGAPDGVLPLSGSLHQCARRTVSPIRGCASPPSTHARLAILRGVGKAGWWTRGDAARHPRPLSHWRTRWCVYPPRGAAQAGFIVTRDVTRLSEAPSYLHVSL